jgi:hypothetical protein
VAPRKSHQHEFNPKKRINRLIVSECTSCPATKTDMIKGFTKEKGAEIDEFLEKLNSGKK